MGRTSASAHPDDETLSSLVDDTTSADATIWEHVDGCIECHMRFEELRTLRRALQSVGSQPVAPPDDLTTRVIGRLRVRQGAIGTVNEVLAALRALFHGFSSLFGGTPPVDEPGRSESRLPHG